MNFAEKLKRLGEGVNKAQAAKRAGLSASAISSYIAKPHSIPRADIVLKMARVFQVSTEWLIDDAAEWPPVLSSPAGLPSASPDAVERERLKRAAVGAIANLLNAPALDRLHAQAWTLLDAQMGTARPDLDAAGVKAQRGRYEENSAAEARV